VSTPAFLLHGVISFEGGTGVLLARLLGRANIREPHSAFILSPFFQEICMKPNFGVASDITAVGLLLILGLSLAAGARAQDKTIASRTADVEGGRLQYLTAGKGPAVILLHGYAETSRMWKPLCRCWRNGLQ
jgi:hypothetical protein